MLTFGKGNAKLKRTATFSLPAGWTCPGALSCLARVDPESGKLTDGPLQTYRCFAASMEARLPSVRTSRWSNFDQLVAAKSTDAMASLILASLPAASLVRIHVSGDFYSSAYLQAWVEVAKSRPLTTFYAYTKQVDILPARAALPANLRIIVSEGTRHDLSTARALGYAVAHVVMSEAEAMESALEIDHDDSHAIAANHDFALLLHGTQAKGSDAARALQELKRSGFTGYGKAA